MQFAFSQLDSGSDKATDAEEYANVTDEHTRTSKNAYLVEMPRWSLEKVILPPSTRLHLEVVLNLIKYHELMFDQWNLRSIMRSTATTLTLNFYGPSGTGKTLAAHAVAHYLAKKVLVVNYAELESKFVGEMNKNIRQVFAIARDADAVLFLMKLIACLVIV